MPNLKEDFSEVEKVLAALVAEMTEKMRALPPNAGVRIYTDKDDRIQIESIDYDDLHNSVMAQYPTIIRRLAVL